MKKKKITTRKRYSAPKKCYFCEEKKEPWFSDVDSLNRFISERGKIIGAERNGLCAKHQRHLGAAIKYARHLSLMPFLVRG